MGNQTIGLKNRWKTFSVSVLIASFLLLQAISVSRKLCPLKLSSRENKSFCDPGLYPFLHYGMYSRPLYEGHRIARYQLIGVLPNSKKIIISPEDFDFDFWLFEEHVLAPILHNNHHKLKKAINYYQNKHQQKLIELQLENQPVIITKSGNKIGRAEIVRTIKTQDIATDK